MSKLLTTTIMILGLKTNVLKASVISAGFGTLIVNWIGEFIPEYFLGITIFLWVIYTLTVMLDWATGISASRFEYKQKNKDFIFDKSKGVNSWYKHALFIIIISAIYQFREEVVIREFSDWIVNGLTGLQVIFFAYNMITEWISIEDNRFRISGKRSRLSKILTNILDILDKGLYNKLKELTKVKNNE